ncbi:SDR family NAD(P)-dependent oxidoreductase [Snodgrassella alvi]|jgi:2,3-dihydro-2,3-dihydroxybenzoate dehydrogenase|uniref:2,3-dihydro-2,3-dihydroxybenzoate dehydrogenase n=1 Tax=Snodgrassella alvi TaxID=1196083 RepID=A0A855FLT6_9NEIS|nr:SDR family NAD(P)-dependent oxidoreductase [Snodgrassella alvi]PIT13767.1 2,3-dihydro-2,3-dihydroxybenzoate dehydrogenase [Snodgrassella alvi]PIT22499.1 2,3-dihydro-2,3-dihydroxybenzoate dehydrogenase [Snodgrassella alvi]PIT55843.1 2,3-dihydro-2,3-dihydroxybenzoate dehydrogenase [Snodgrassella alvi]PIT59296.1 2,3-dihydro-2,3-dihydroxybenzoate dehydrogenase [Snodgrassella alvi]
MQSAIIVTGAAQGIGAAVVSKLLQQNYHVIGIDKQPAPANWPVQQMIAPQYQHHWLGVSQNITDFEETQILLNTLIAQHHITGLVNVAGILILTPLLNATETQWQSSLNVNLLAPIFISQHLARHFHQQQHGSIVTVSSNSARMPRTQLGLYATTKAALSHFCRNLALEVAPYVRVNIVSPGSTHTAMQQQLWPDNQPPASIINGDLNQYRLGIPLRKLAQPADIANTVSFLLSEQAAQITMQEIVVDGGATLGV